MASLLTVLSVVAPVFVVAGIGFAFGRMHRGDGSELNAVAFNLFVPALVFQTMIEPTLPLDVVGQVAIAATVVFLGCGALAVLIGQRSRGFLLTAMTPNNANMGISLCAFAFGAEVAPFATAYYATTAALTLTVGLQIVSGGMRPRALLRVPFIWAIACGVIVRLAGGALPASLQGGVDILAAAAIPAMLVALGHRLSRARLGGLRVAALSTLVRMGGGALLALGCVQLLSLSGLIAKVVLLQAIMPSAVITTVLSQEYDADAEQVASTVAFSTLVSVLVIPVALMLMG